MSKHLGRKKRWTRVDAKTYLSGSGKVVYERNGWYGMLDYKMSAPPEGEAACRLGCQAPDGSARSSGRSTPWSPWNGKRRPSRTVTARGFVSRTSRGDAFIPWLNGRLCATSILSVSCVCVLQGRGPAYGFCCWENPTIPTPCGSANHRLPSVKFVEPSCRKVEHSPAARRIALRD